MMTRTRRLTALAAVAVAVLAVRVSAQSQRSPSGEREAERLHMMLKAECKRGDCNLSGAEMETLRGDMGRYAQRGGHEEQMRGVVQASLDAGCRGVCLAETIRSMNHLMERGQSDRQARDIVATALRDEKREREQKKLQLTDAQYQERLHARMEREHGSDHDREHERMREAGREMQHGPSGAGREGVHQGGR